MKTLKKYLINISLVALSIIFTLSVIEIILRITNRDKFNVWQTEGSFRLDSELLYTLTPNYNNSIELDYTIEPRQYNSLGLRDKEIGSKKPGIPRVLIMGDSFTYGHGVKLEDSYPKILEKLFLKNNKSVEVINAGVPGYGSDQYFKFFKTRLYKLEPDYVIVSFNDSDLYDNFNHPLYILDNLHDPIYDPTDKKLIPINPKKVWIYYLGKISFHTPRFLKYSQLYHYIMKKYENSDIFHFVPRKDCYYQLAWSLSKFMLEIYDLQNYSRKNNYKLLVIRMPDISFIVSDIGNKHYPPGIFEYLHDSLIRKNINYIDSNAYFKTLPFNSPKPIFQQDQYHLTEYGNQVLAQFAFDSIQKYIK